MLRRLFAALSALLLALLLCGIATQSAVAVQPPVVFDNDCNQFVKICDITIPHPGGGGSTSPGSGVPGSPGRSNTSSGCQYNGQTILCSTSSGGWNAARGCYVQLASDQSQGPPLKDHSGQQGGWYTCATPGSWVCTSPTGPGCLQTSLFWAAQPPAGAPNTLSPAEAAAELIKTFRLRGIDIGMAPDPGGADPKSYVGVPIWMWVADPQPLTYGPYTKTATLGGVTITATARVTTIRWDMGDGHTVTCASKGTAYTTSYGVTDSPTCGYRYMKTSGGGTYTVTATSQWVVEWTGGGANGQQALTTASATAVRIQELQSVNLPAGG